MAKIKNNNEITARQTDGTNLIFKDMERVMHDSMLPYAEHVIMNRALPRVEDGLKPVQRRILYTMHELGITPDKAYLKSARIVGDCMGKYHPHGDSSIYEALVRMAQDFSLGMPLVDGQGNFGSDDGDGAAAMRYTEAKLAPLALELLADIDKETVSWSRNYDDSRLEPDVLPGRFPNLLVNGTNGIAVGFSTNIPPHNFQEVIDGVIAYVDDESISLEKMLSVIKGPDFPTGGIALVQNPYELYSTGKGTVILQGRVHIENERIDRQSRKSIVVTELPYGLARSKWLTDVLNLRQKKNLTDIVEIVDESDKEGMRAVIRLKKEADAQAILETLYKETKLRSTVGVQMIAIADEKPAFLGLMDIIRYYTAYQKDIIAKRTRFDLKKAKEREHIVKGLVIAVRNIDEVINIIKKADNTTAAKNQLKVRFSLSDEQAQAILDLRLARITKLEVGKLESELKELEALIKKLERILADKRVLSDLLKSELKEIRNKYKTERRTTLLSSIDELDSCVDCSEPADENYVISVNSGTAIKKMLAKNYSMSSREPSSMKDVLNIAIKAKTGDTVYGFTDRGNCFVLDTADLPLVKYRDKGARIDNYVAGLADNESIVALYAYETLPETTLVWVTKEGLLKRTDWQDCQLSRSNFYPVMTLRGDDRVIAVMEAGDAQGVLMVTKYGMGLNVGVDEIPVQGRVTTGVQGMTVDQGDEVIACDMITDEGEIFVITDKGSMKRVFAFEFAPHPRRRKGIKIIEFGVNGSCLVFAKYVTDAFTVAFANEEGLHTVFTDDVKIETRQHKGKVIYKGNVSNAARLINNEQLE